MSNKFLKFIKYIEKVVDLKGGTFVALFSLTMLFKVIFNSTIGGDAIAIYGLVLTNFMINKTAKLIKEDKDGHKGLKSNKTISKWY